MEIFAATLKGGQTYSPDYEAETYTELLAKVAKHQFESENSSDVRLEAITKIDIDSGREIFLDRKIVEQAEIEIGTQMIGMIGDDISYVMQGLSQSPITL